MTYRINGYEQIKSFYSWVFNNQDKSISTAHISLYVFFINQNNRSNWCEWFKCPYDLAMSGSCIGSRNTYYKCLSDLKGWKLIDYKKGINNYKAPLIKLQVLKNEHLTEHVPVPLSEQVTEQVIVPLTEHLPIHIYKLLTNNLKLVTDNLDAWIKKEKNKKPPKEGETSSLHSDMKNIFLEFYKKKTGEEYYWTAKDGASIKQLISKTKKKLREKEIKETDQKMCESFNLLLTMIKDKWILENLSTALINSKFNEIIQNGKAKQGITTATIRDVLAGNR